MKRKTTLTVCGCILSGCIATVLTQNSSPPASAAPAPRPLLAAAASRPRFFTIRYMAFVVRPKTAEDTARYETFPPVLDRNWNLNSRYVMNTTPENFSRVLRADQPDCDFIVSFVGSDVLHSDTTTQITGGPNPSDPHGLAVIDDITISQNSDGSLDFVSKGGLFFRPIRLPEMRGKMGWNGENKELMVGRTYKWGAQKEDDGTFITWAFCILPGRLDQVASAWNHHGAAKVTALASNRATEGRSVK